MKYISLFSGIEAASVAWNPLGCEPIAFCEFDKTPSKVLAKNFPNIPNLGDVTKVDWNKYHGTANIVVGGSPCQAFSVAGARKGLNDLRGQLMLEYLRACAEIDPEWIVWENVPGVLSSNGGRDFATLLNCVSKLWGARGGGGGHGECLTLNTSEYPNDVKESSLSSILTTGDVPSTCFMTVQACRGILARLDKRPKLSEPAGLRDACQGAIKSNVA